jgi:hypothetical protein
MKSARFAAALGVAVAGFGTLSLVSHGAVHGLGPFTMATAIGLPTSDGGTEPRETVVSTGPHPGYYVISNTGGTATVWESNDGGKTDPWHITGPIAIGNQTVPTIDVDIVSMPAGSTNPGRLIAIELDFGGVNFRTSYSDDGGVNWTVSTTTGSPVVTTAPSTTQLADQDRPWLATGPNDRAYLLFHNLASGVANHNMYVATSNDGGAHFDAPQPVTIPNTQAYLDLQCADSGGPSNLFVNPRDGRVYAVFGTRSSAVAGGCGASVTGTLEVNVVAATRVWVATAPAASTETPGAWTQSLAVDDNTSGFIVGMQLAPAALDSADNLYVVYPESTHQYPNYDGAAIKFVHAPQNGALGIVANPYGLLGPANQVWSAPVTVDPPVAGAPGDLLPHVVAGGSGQIDVAYFHGQIIPNSSPATIGWYLVTAQSLDALDSTPVVSPPTPINYPGGPPAPVAAYSGWTASQMMGACNPSGPAAGVLNGLNCNRSTDVWGVALDSQGAFQVTWPGAPLGNFGCSSPCNETFVTTQTDGPTIGPPGPGPDVPEAPFGLPLIAIGGVVAAAAGVWSRRRRASIG